jgi:hypothetical protein
MSTTESWAVEDPPIENMMQALNQRVLLVCPSISYWHGMYQLPRSKTVVATDGQTIDSESVTTPQAKLMTDTYPVDRAGYPWKKRFNKINSRLSAIKEKYSLPFPITGVRIVPKARSRNMLHDMIGLTLGTCRTRRDRARERGDEDEADKYADMVFETLRIHGTDAPADVPVFDPDRSVQSVAYDLHVAAHEFCEDLADVLRQIETKSQVFDQVQSKIPKNPGVMRKKFALNITPVELAGGGRSETLTEDDLLAHSDAVRATCQRQVEAAITEMIQGPRQQLAKALADLKERVNNNSKIKSNSFNAVREAISKIRMFDFVANSELLTQIGQLEQRLDNTNTAKLDATTAASSGFAAALDKFIDEVEDAEKQSSDFEEFGRNLRSIEL